MESVWGSNASRVLERRLSAFPDGIGADETAIRRHAMTVGRDNLLFGIESAETSRMQYAKFRMPMSMLRIRLGEEFWGPLLGRMGMSSSIKRLVRSDLVPDVEMPHWKARDFSWASLNEGGILIAMHVGVDEFYHIYKASFPSAHSSGPLQLILVEKLIVLITNQLDIGISGITNFLVQCSLAHAGAESGQASPPIWNQLPLRQGPE